jgi:hypothetical protein
MRIGSTAALVDLPVPSLRYSLDVNTLNFCRFSLLRCSSTSERTTQGLIALPNLVESGAVSGSSVTRSFDYGRIYGLYTEAIEFMPQSGKS